MTFTAQMVSAVNRQYRPHVSTVLGKYCVDEKKQKLIIII